MKIVVENEQKKTHIFGNERTMHEIKVFMCDDFFFLAFWSATPDGVSGMAQ